MPSDERRFSASIAIKLQREMSSRVIVEPLDISSVRVVAGLDVGYRKGVGFAVAVAIDRGSGSELCHVAVESSVEVPYVPGLLAFREAPIMVAALRELSRLCVEPDAIMVNGHGLAHPRRLGIASHIGVALDIPSVGIAKKRLFGEERVENGRVALYAFGEKVGYVLRMSGAKTYVTVGHRVDPDTALELSLSLWRSGRRFPIPIEVADSISKRVAREIGKRL
ncbi:MAG: endonuclease V [Crenarchaeota archaeon]|nr:endonuclease V [Thermoproteota archaeon]